MDSIPLNQPNQTPMEEEPVQDSRDLFMELLERKLKEEEERMKQGLPLNNNPTQPRKPIQRKTLKKNNNTKPQSISDDNNNMEDDNIETQKLEEKQEENNSEIVDEYSTSEPVNVLDKVKESWYTEVQDAKWSTRRDALLELKNLINFPKLQTAEYSQITDKIMSIIEEEKNVIVIKVAVECIELFSKGLRSNFIFSFTNFVEKVLPKMKEKKLVETVCSCICTIEKHCISFNELSPLFIVSISSKIPSEKTGTLTIVEQCCATKNFEKIKDSFDNLCESILKAADDSNKDIREAAFKALGRLLWLSGANNFDRYLTKLDKLKADKVKEYCTGFGDPPKQTVTKPTFSKPSNNNESKSAPQKKVSAKPKNPPTKRKVEIKEESSQPATTKRKVGGNSNKPAVAVDTSSVKFSISSEEALSRAEQFITPSGVLDNLTSTKWKEKLDALEQILLFISNVSEDEMAENADVIVLTLGSKPGWKESNLQVFAKVLEIICKIIETTSTLSTGAASTVIEGIVEKLATPKLKEQTITCLLLLSELFTPQFVVSQVYKHITDHKNPKVTSEGLSALSKIVEDFALKTIDVKQLIDFTKLCLSSTKPAIKKGATDLLCCMKKFLGDSLLNYLGDVKPALLDAIKKDFAKVDVSEPPQATRQLRNAPSDNTPNSTSTASSLGDMLPRSDISNKLTAKTFKDMEDKNWKVRLEALQEVINAINEANKRITPNVSNLIQALKKRLDDANVKILSTTLEILALLAEAMGNASDKFCNAIMPFAILRLSHNNKAIRSATYSTLEAWVKVVNLDNLLKYFDKSLCNDKGHPDGRKDALQFIDTYLPEMKTKTVENFQIIIKSLINCLQDPKAGTRKLAENIIEKIINAVGVEFVKDNCRDIKQVFKKSIMAIVDRYSQTTPPIQEKPKTITQTLTVAEITKRATIKTDNIPVTTSNSFNPIQAPIQQPTQEDRSSRKTLVQGSLFNRPVETLLSVQPTQPTIPSTPKQQVKLQFTSPSTPGSIKRGNAIPQPKDSVFTTPKKMKVNHHAPVEENLLLSPTNLLSPKKGNVPCNDKKDKYDISQILTTLSNTKTNNFPNAITAMKMLDVLIETNSASVVLQRESVVSTLTTFIEHCFDAVTFGLSGPRVCKYLINTLMCIFECKPISLNITKYTLYKLIDTILHILLNDKLPNIEYGDKIITALNSLMLKILENSSRTIAYSCLISMLEKACLDHEEESNRFTKIVVKCLNKLSKTIDRTVDIIDIESILLDINNFLTNNSPTYFQGKDDLPLVTIKTIVNRLVRLKEQGIKRYISRIPSLNSTLLSFIEHELSNINSPSTTTNTIEIDNSVLTTTQPQPNNDVLKDICTMIGNKETSKTGLYKLYYFQLQNPVFKLKEYLGTTHFSPIFQEYILRSVAKIAAHEQAKIQKESETDTALKEIPGTPKSKFSIEDYRKELKMKSTTTSTSLNLQSSTFQVQNLKDRLAQVKVNTNTSTKVDLEALRRKYRNEKSSFPLEGKENVSYNPQQQQM
ncbi:hypothetical protein ABK040_005770 [Willaertia magna]